MFESVEETLDQHLALCEETYHFIFEENRILKQTGEPPDQEFLREKRGLLLRFDVSNQALNEADRTEARRFRPSIEKAQQVVLKTLLLDRENEQLLLKCTLGQKPKPLTFSASPEFVQKTYRSAASQDRATAERTSSQSPTN